ncbi:MFS general substrate transporter [Hyaloscypha hepaticicola]|uniref:MFS general substrate transporter n=1 Tax=Hyaloscypha hepaticicola TaxID=2082293 RepID=A0A2J6PYV1_9HELO|nr:MFS general substrate transporter [Hyaloscypha hepaticicola]
MITGCAFQLLYSRLFTFYAPKWVFLASVTIFELGSLVCGVSRNSPTFIVGRAIASLGSAGIMSGMIVLTVHTIPLRKRPLYQSLMGIVFMISSVTGPIIGGAFTTHLTWRWCFYLNLPIGGATLLLAFWLLPSNNNKTKEEIEATKLSTREKIERVDPIGTLCFLPGIVCLLLALQLGGSTYAWNNWRIILVWIMFGILIITFAAVQMWKQENATIPPRILRYRSVTASTFFAFCISGSMTVVVYFLPLWFQAIEGVDAIESGIRLLPLILALLLSSIIAGGTVSAMGYYTPMLIACSVIMSVGAGLMTTFRVDAGKAIWIGYQVIFGFGVGFSQQQAGLAAQTVLPAVDVPTGVSLKFFGQMLGRSNLCVGCTECSQHKTYRWTGWSPKP